MSILTQFKALTPEEIVLMYDTLLQSIKFHTDQITGWKLYKERLAIEQVDMRLVVDYDKTEKYYEKMEIKVKSFIKILDKIKPLKEVVNDE